MKVYENVIVLTAEFAPFKSKRNGRLALNEVDAMVNLEQSMYHWRCKLLRMPKSNCEASRVLIYCCYYLTPKELRKPLFFEKCRITVLLFVLLSNSVSAYNPRVSRGYADALKLAQFNSNTLSTATLVWMADC